MALLTTTIGAYPKPDYVPVPDWFQQESTIAKNPTEAYEIYLRNRPSDIEEILDRATREVVQEQVNVGIDVPTDGEIRRENYIPALSEKLPIPPKLAIGLVDNQFEQAVCAPIARY